MISCSNMIAGITLFHYSVKCFDSFAFAFYGIIRKNEHVRHVFSILFYLGELISPKEFTIRANKDKQKDWKGSIRIGKSNMRYCDSSML